MKGSFFSALVVLALTGVVALGLVMITSPDRSGAASSPAGFTGTQTWGDLDCDNEVGTRDNQGLLRNVLQQPALSQTEPCPDIGETVTLTGGQEEMWGDLDCDGEVGTRDNQGLLRNVLQQPALSQTEPCPDIGQDVTSGPTPTPDPARVVDLIAIDTDITGNGPNVIGTIESCVSVPTGESVEVDVVVDEIPATGVAGFQFDLMFDPDDLEIPAPGETGAPDVSQMLGAGGVDFSLGDPEDDGTYVVAAADFDAVASGQGVLARITVQGLTAGTHTLTLSFDGPNNSINQTAQLKYTITEVQSAQIAVGEACA